MQNLFWINAEFILNKCRIYSELKQNLFWINAELIQNLFWINAEFILN